MKKHSALIIILIAGLLMPQAARSLAQSREELREEFHQTYSLAPDGRVSLENISGFVRIVGWERNEVKVDAVKHAYRRERLDEARIKVDADASSIRIKTEYPSESLNFNSNWPRREDNPASVDYTLSVPRNARIGTIELINGDLSIQDITNEVRASSINGRVEAKSLTGRVKLSTINGRLEAAFDRLDEANPIQLSSVNGSVNLILSSDARAHLDAGTVHGSISNDFGLPVRRGEYVGQNLEGLLGGGGVRIKLDNVNGSISIRHASDGRPLSPASNLLSDVTGRDRYNSEADEARREADRERREALREAERERVEAERERQRAQREVARDRLEAAREVENAKQEAEREKQQALVEAEREKQQALRDAERERQEALREAERARQQALREADEARREALRESQGMAAEGRRNVGYYGGSRYVERETKSFNVSGSPRVTAQTFDGNITVSAWDRPEVAVNLVKRGGDERSLQGIRFRADQRGQEVILSVNFDKSFAQRVGSGIYNSPSANLEINVPRSSNLKLSSGDGRVTLEGVSGEIDINTGDGNIEVRDGRGRVMAHTGDGSIRVSSFSGDLDVNTGDGRINLDGRFQNLKAVTGDGSITLSLPPDVNAIIETNSESVVSDGSAVQETAGEQRRIRRWRIGQGGPTFTLRTGDGRIYLRRIE